MKDSLLAIDPGANQGWAFFQKLSGEWTLIRCGLGVIPASICPESVVIEQPVIYPHAKARPNDIITLALAAGTTVGRLVARWPDLETNVHWVQPRAWKGTINADIMTRRIESKMGPVAMDMVKELNLSASKRHNVVDAVGLGLYFLNARQANLR